MRGTLILTPEELTRVIRAGAAIEFEAEPPAERERERREFHPAIRLLREFLKAYHADHAPFPETVEAAEALLRRLDGPP